MVEKESEKNGISINKAFISLTAKALSSNGKINKRSSRKKTVYRDLDSLSGLLTKEEAKIFEENLYLQRKIDDNIWKAGK